MSVRVRTRTSGLLGDGASARDAVDLRRRPRGTRRAAGTRRLGPETTRCVRTAGGKVHAASAMCWIYLYNSLTGAESILATNWNICALPQTEDPFFHVPLPEFPAVDSSFSPPLNKKPTQLRIPLIPKGWRKLILPISLTPMAS